MGDHSTCFYILSGGSHDTDLLYPFPPGARKIVHELIFCSLLMETEYKRLFAIEFTKVPGSDPLWRGFGVLCVVAHISTTPVFLLALHATAERLHQ